MTSGHTYVMGILNVTPDSFSDGGNWADTDRALRHAEEMIGEGADVLDIGGESTRPGYTEVPEEEEIRRVVPVIEAVRKHFDVPVSLDTCKAAVAEAGIAAGAQMINDIWGLKYDGGRMAEVIGNSGLPCCLMHNRRQAEYSDFMGELLEDLSETLRIAEAAGIVREKIILDPGVGFAKDRVQNLRVIARLEELNGLGCPLLIGCSRKSVVGNTLDLPVDQRLEGTLATTVLAVERGCMFVRVHDVKENVRAVRMTEAVLREGIDHAQ